MRSTYFVVVFLYDTLAANSAAARADRVIGDHYVGDTARSARWSSGCSPIVTAGACR